MTSILSLVSIAVIAIFVFGIMLGCFKRIEMTSTTSKIVLTILLICVAGLAYCFYPKDIGDLAVHIWIIDKLSIGGIEQFKNNLGSDPLFIRQLYYYIISLTGNSYLIMPITITIFYGCIIGIVYLIKKEYKISSLTISWYVLLIFSVNGFCSVWGSVRMPLSWSIASLCITREIIRQGEKKVIESKLFWTGLVVSSFMHVAGIVPFIIYFLNKYLANSKAVRIALLSVMMLFGVLEEILSSFSNEYLNLIGEKVDLYQSDSIYQIARGLYYPEIILLIVITFVLIRYVLPERNYSINPITKKFISFYEMFVFLCWGSIFNGQIFNRWMYLLPLISLPFFMLFRREYQNKKLNPIFLLFICLFIFFVRYNYNVLIGAYKFGLDR